VAPRNPSPFANQFCGFINIFSRFGYFVGSNMAFRKEAFLKAGGYSLLNRGEDWELSSRLKGLGKTVHVPEAVAYVDVPPNRVSEMLAAHLAAAFGLIGVASPFLAGLSSGFFITELATAFLQNPTGIHHSTIGLAGLSASPALSLLGIPKELVRGAQGFFSGVTWHHLMTEDIPNSISNGRGNSASSSVSVIAPLWLALNLILG
jgi:hypothetical protein